MDQSSIHHNHGFSGYWFICKYCQRMFRDKLDLFCHQVGEHPECRGDEEEVEVDMEDEEEVIEPEPIGQQHTVQNQNSTMNEVSYADTSSHFRPSTSTSTPQEMAPSSSLPWFPPSSAAIIPPQTGNPQNYVVNPVQYFVLVSNSDDQQQEIHEVDPIQQQQFLQLQEQQLLFPQEQLYQQELPQQFHEADFSYQTMAQNLQDTIEIENDATNSRMSGNSSDTDTMDYYCWKCQVKYENASSYMQHSSTCFLPTDRDRDRADEDFQNQTLNLSDLNEYENEVIVQSASASAPKKRGRKPKAQQQQQQMTEGKVPKGQGQRPKPRPRSNQGQEIEVIDLESDSDSEEAPAASTKRLKKLSPSQVPQKRPENQEIIGNTYDEINGNVNLTDMKIPQHPRNFPCVHCNVKFKTNDKLTTHLLQCKLRKNPYDTYDYKCIKCNEAFEIYLEYKRHIATHTGEVRYS